MSPEFVWLVVEFPCRLSFRSGEDGATETTQSSVFLLPVVLVNHLDRFVLPETGTSSVKEVKADLIKEKK